MSERVSLKNNFDFISFSVWAFRIDTKELISWNKRYNSPSSLHSMREFSFPDVYSFICVIACSISLLWLRKYDEKYIDGNTLTVYIRRLRTKIEDMPSTPNKIVTVRRMGYKLDSNTANLKGFVT